MPLRRLAPALATVALLAMSAGAARAAAPSAYAMDSGAPGGVFEFDMGSDGFLAPKASGPAGAGSSTQDMAIVPSGAFGYAVSGSSIYPFSIGPAGELAAPGGPVAAGTNMVSIAVSPDGRSVYAADKAGNAIYEYSVGAGGGLTPISPGSQPAGTGPTSVAVSPDGGTVYAVNSGSHDISRYPVGASGVLGAPGATIPAGTTTLSAIALTPDGHSAYVTDTGANLVREFDVTAGGGLAQKATVPSGVSPTGIAVSPDGRSVYVANSGDGTVSQYDVGAGGLLGAKTGAAGLVGGATPQRLALSPSGTRLYVPDADSGHNVVYEFALTGSGTIDGTSAHFVGAGPAPVAVTVAPDQGPAAAFTATAGPSGQPTAFDGRASTDADGSVTHFDWDFGDGSSALDAGPAPAHAYARAGTYSVTLSVSDDAGCSTREVFTGRTAYCNGGPAAVTTRTVVVPSPPSSTPVFFAGVAAKSQTVRIDRHGLARISVRCPRGTFGSCIGTLSLVSAGKVRVPRRSGARRAAKRLLLGQVGFNIASGKAVKIPIQISSAGRKVILKKHSLKANASITAHDRLGTSKKTAFSVRLKRPKRRR